MPINDIVGVTLSLQADNFVMINTAVVPQLAEPKIDHWIPDEKVSKCPLTSKDFGLFCRRHHCRISGGVYTDEVCNY